MSLVTVRSSLFALSPRVYGDEDRLIAQSPLSIQIACLGYFCKTVVADPVTRTVILSYRYLWALRAQRTIPFDAISHIQYRCSEFHLGRVHTESYSLALALDDGSEVGLFTFSGDGASGLAFVLVESQGDQEQRSRSYLDALMATTGKRLSKLSSRQRAALDYRNPATSVPPLELGLGGPIASDVSPALPSEVPSPPSPTSEPEHAAHAHCSIHDLAAGPDGRCVLCRRAVPLRPTALAYSAYDLVRIVHIVLLVAAFAGLIVFVGTRDVARRGAPHPARSPDRATQIPSGQSTPR